MSVNQWKRHQIAKATLKALFSQPDRVYVIHYSCESFYDRADGSSPRITSVAIRNLDSAQTISFSIHKEAELKGVPINAINSSYDFLEKGMLDQLAKHLGQLNNATYLHWNMRGPNYGFQAIEHRHRVLEGDPYVVPDDRKIDLARLFVSLYGEDYIEHPRMENLLKLNKSLSSRDFLAGQEEAVAFQQQRYVDLYLSTIKKVDVISHLAQRAYDGKLKTKASLLSVHGLSMELILSFVYGVLAILATIGGVIALITSVRGLFP